MYVRSCTHLTILNECKSELMAIISKIFNLSTKTGEMPKDFKHYYSAPQKEGFRAYLQKLSRCVWITLLIQSN